MKKDTLHGQVLLITVLVLSIAVTIALSLIGRSVSDISMSRNLEESARAFSAAEAGLEEALGQSGMQQNVLIPGSNIIPGVSYDYVSAQLVTTGAYTLPTTSLGQVETIWLVEHDTATNAIDETKPYAGTTFDICWKPSVAGGLPALETVLYYKEKTSGLYKVQHGAYDPDGARYTTNKFSLASEGSCGDISGFKQTITIPPSAGDVTIPLLVRIRPFYESTTITVVPETGINLPNQGSQITSTGKTNGGVTRKIVVKRQYPRPASIFDYSIYSQDSFMH